MLQLPLQGQISVSDPRTITGQVRLALQAPAPEGNGPVRQARAAYIVTAVDRAEDRPIIDLSQLELTSKRPAWD